MKKKLLTLALSSSFVVGASFAGQAAEKNAGAQLVESLSKNMLTVERTIPVSESLEAYVVAPKEGGQKMVVFTAENGKYLIAGNVVDSKGDNLTRSLTEKYILSGVAKAALSEVAGTHWFVQGSDKAAHKAYIVIDPNCIFCHLLYKELYPMIEKGDLQVRWVPVGFLKEDSASKAAALLAADSDADKVKMLHQDETQFDAKHEEGGIQPLKDDKSVKATAAFKAVTQNTAFFQKNGFGGTPTMLYVDNEGKPAFYPGYAKGDELKALVAKMSSKWK